MKTTEVLVEHFVGGVLMTAALFFVFWSLLPGPSQLQLKAAICNEMKEYATIIGLVLTAVVYSVGLLAESMARTAFDILKMDPIKERRLTEYIRANRSNLAKSPILARFVNAAAKNRRDASDVVGLMRFEVMRSSPQALYREVESSLNRLRLVRILFFVEILVLLGLALCWFQYSQLWRFWLSGLVVLVPLAITNWLAIDYRCKMYCRAIERSYRLLVLDPPTATQSGGRVDMGLW
ncbi:MAG: hypothetical protein HYR60_04295 [Acidobacteria bacterium]|nr:hypothetical protein [Acidobacteriota bacterium]